MPYIGNNLATQFQAFVTQTITGDGSTGYTLDKPVTNGKELLVYINNVKQEEGAGKAYTATGTTITFSEAVASSDSCYLVYLGSAVGTISPSDASVGSAQITNDTLVMPNKLDMNGKELILDADADTSIEASTDDTIVIDTAGTEQMRINSDGDLLIGKTARDQGVVGCQFRTDGIGALTADGSSPFRINRLTDTGVLVNMQQAGSTVGTISTINGDLNIGTGDTGLQFRDSVNAIRPHDVDGAANRDNAIDLGQSSVRFDDIFASSGTVNSSDKNEKQDIASLTDKELKVANKLSALFKTYRWKDRVVEKGDKARTHSGIIAQDIQSAFSAEGLDAYKYGLFCSDTWWEKDKEIYDTKEEAPKDATEKTRLSVRYTELFSFIFSSIEARLTALESK